MRRRLLLFVMVLGLMPVLAYAGEEANAPTATGETGLFTLLTGDTIPQGSWSFSLYYNNWDRLLDVDVPGDDEPSLDWNRLSASLGYGITERWELSLSVPYDDYQFDDDDFFGDDLDVSGIGNARLGTKLRLKGERGSDVTLALNLFVELPTGDDDVASDDAGFGGGLGWRARNWVFDVGYRDPGDQDDFDVPEELHAGIGYAGSISERLDWITELAGTFYSGGEEGLGFDDSYDLTSGGRLWLGAEEDWAFNFALRTDLNQISSIDEHCPIGGLIGLTYFPRLKAEPPPPPPPPAPPPPAEERVTVNFTPGSARLSNIAKAKLDEVALKMKQDPDLRAEVLGYSDPSGSAEGNQRISEQRAEAVKSYLVTRHGIDPGRITTEGRGSQDSTGDPAQDRRAVVILTVQ